MNPPSVAPAAPLLTGREWKPAYETEDGDLVELFYNPALACAKFYNRMTGYFSATALALAARGVAGMIANDGHMRLVVGCTLNPPEVEAIRKGHDLRALVEAKLATVPLDPPDEAALQGLELLAWMIANGSLEVKVAIPIDRDGNPTPTEGTYHAKVGIIKDAEENRLAFSGSINETAAGWRKNSETFHVYCSWSETRHVKYDEESFDRLWNGRTHTVCVMDVPEAVKLRLLEFLPKSDIRISTAPQPGEVEPDSTYRLTPDETRTVVWTYIREAARLANGIRVGECTSAVNPWPHQSRTFWRFMSHWPCRLLIADEVGLGKTISAGLILRQAWLSGQARRVLLLVPKGVMIQWQNELYERFNLNVPLYDGGKLIWRKTHAGLQPPDRAASKEDWLEEPFVIASSQLMRRRDRALVLTGAKDWDLILLDEAHHARRRSAGMLRDERPNTLLKLMRELRNKTKALLLLTATPMQVDPIEVWDLLWLLGLPESWDEASFRRYFSLTGGNPGDADFQFLAGMFGRTEAEFGAMTEADVNRLLPDVTGLRRRRILRALRDVSGIPLRRLDAQDRQAALRLLTAYTPVRSLMARQTRELLRRYGQKIARRETVDRPVPMLPAEEELYKAVEEYISKTYNNAAPEKRNAIGFVMTIYRRRLASSFYALRQTLNDRLARMGRPAEAPEAAGVEEDLSQDEAGEEVMDGAQACALVADAAGLEESGAIKELLKKIALLSGKDSKARKLKEELTAAFGQGYDSAIVFTQYTDTVDYLKEYLAEELPGLTIATYTGDGGAQRDASGTWVRCSKETVKRRLREGRIRLLVANDAAGEGLNLQYCGVVVNYDLPWNPMKVEQRIGRIDRIGQKHDVIRVVNLAYKETVEADVYFRLGERINLFQGIVGKLQPILSRLPSKFEELALERSENRDAARQQFLADVENMVAESERAAFDIDVVAEEDLTLPALPPPAMTLEEIDRALNRAEVRPPALEWRPLDPGTYALKLPGMPAEVRATTSGEVFEYSDNHELLSPGGAVFDRLSEEHPTSAAPAGGKGVCWLAHTAQGKRVILQTQDGPQEVDSLNQLIDALQRVGSPSVSPGDGAQLVV